MSGSDYLPIRVTCYCCGNTFREEETFCAYEGTLGEYCIEVEGICFECCEEDVPCQS